jgi:hypothetical protein
MADPSPSLSVPAPSSTLSALAQQVTEPGQTG